MENKESVLDNMSKEAKDSLLMQWMFKKGKEAGIRQEKERTVLKIMELSHCVEDISYVTGLSKKEIEEFLSDRLFGEIKETVDELQEEDVKDIMQEGETIEELRQRLKDAIQKPHYVLADKEMIEEAEKRYKRIKGES